MIVYSRTENMTVNSSTDFMTVYSRMFLLLFIREQYICLSVQAQTLWPSIRECFYDCLFEYIIYDYLKTGYNRLRDICSWRVGDITWTARANEVMESRPRVEKISICLKLATVDYKQSNVWRSVISKWSKDQWLELQPLSNWACLLFPHDPGHRDHKSNRNSFWLHFWIFLKKSPREIFLADYTVV